MPAVLRFETTDGSGRYSPTGHFECSVSPGRPATVTVHVRNTGREVEGVALDLLFRREEPFATVVSAPLELLPGAEAPMTMLINPSPTSGLRAGEHVIGVRANLRHDSRGSFVEEVSVRIAPVGAIQLEVVPRTIVAGTVAEARVTNAANVAQTIHLGIEDPEAALDVRPEPATVEAAPGQTVTVRLPVKLRRRPQRGSTTSVPYRCVAHGPHGRAVADGTVTGSRRSVPIGRVLAALAALAVVVVAIVGGIIAWDQLRGGVAVPDVRTLDLASARTVLAERGFGVSQLLASVANESEVGRVIEQDPGPDERGDEGDTVVVTIGTQAASAAVPNVVNQLEEQALAQLEGAGFFNVSVTQSQSDEDKGVVTNQTPRAGGGRVPLDSPIAIVVSAGPAARAVPTVAGATEDEALEALQEAGFRATVQRRSDPEVDEGRVIGTDPSGQADPSQPIVVIVSDGPEQGQVPTLVGLTREAALQRLLQTGFTLGPEDEKQGPANTSGRVVDQSPDPGTTADAGSPIGITIGRAPPSQGQVTSTTRATAIDPRLIPGRVTATTTRAASK